MPQAEKRPITFALDDANEATHIRVTVIYSESDTEVLTITKTGKDTKPFPKGHAIATRIDAEGNPGKRAVLKVTNGTPTSWSRTFPNGSTNVFAIKAFAFNWK